MQLIQNTTIQAILH